MAEIFDALSAAVEGMPRRRPYLIGVSGGRDSMVLLHALRHLGFDRLVVCHLDHGLRGAAARADRHLVKRWSGKLGLAFEEGRADVGVEARERGCSIELAARKCRHRFFEDCGLRHRARRIFLAHHGDDQAETILFNFLRGSGPAGLAGMKTMSTVGRLTLLRPLLQTTRDDLARFAAEHGVPFREDESNTDPAHTRNRLRHEVLPLLRDVMGHRVEAVLCRSGLLQGELADWLETSLPPRAESLSCAALRALPQPVRRRAILRWLRGEGVEAPGFAETSLVLGLLDAEKPARINLPRGWHVRRRSGHLTLEKP